MAGDVAGYDRIGPCREEDPDMPRTPRRRPSMEQLEDRRLPANFGIPWPDPGHLTVSFVPDGTPVGSSQSSLYATLNSTMPTANWQRTILSAVQSWADLANINVGLVTDNGQAAGQPGPLQGNPNFGDIRFAARPLSPDVLGLATPFDLLNNWSGDIILNSTIPFSRGTANDLFTAVLHEAGHVFGLDDNPNDPSSAMYPVLNTPKSGPDSGDILALRALYGARASDAYEGASGDDSLATAIPMTFVNLAAIAGSMPPAVNDNGDPTGPNGPWLVNADLTTPSDADLFVVKAPSDGEPLAAAVHVAGISLLTPKVTIDDSSGNLLSSASSSDPLSSDVTVSLPGTIPGATYYVRVEAATNSVFGIGSYRIAVGSPSVSQLLTTLPLSNGAVSSGHGKGAAFEKAVTLKPQTPGTDARWPYVVHDALSTTNETDFYRFITPPPTASGAPETVVITTWGLQPGGFIPAITVLDASRKPVPIQILNRDAANVTIQIPSAQSSSAYVVEVSAADPSSRHAVGGYFLGIDFLAQPIPQVPLASGALDSDHPGVLDTLVVPSTELFHFSLSGDTGSARVPTAVRMTLLDTNANPIFNVRAYGGSGPTSGDVVLAPGTYIARIIAAAKPGTALPMFMYSLLGTIRSDPIGPAPTDPTMTPTGTTDGGNPSGGNPTGWSPGTDPTYAGFLSLTDATSNPWM
jgi:hypothetical protein